MLSIVHSTRSRFRRKMLGISIGEKSVLIAELSAASANGGHAFEATRLAEFAFPEGLTLLDAEALGDALGAFLKQQEISVRQAVVGIPAKWIVVKSKQVPPAEPTVIADSLRLQAEGEFSSALSDLVYDYAGQTSTAEARQVLLMATPRHYIDQTLALAKAARLDVVAVTPSAASLGWATNRCCQDALVLSLGSSGAELTSGGPRGLLRHLGPVPANAPGAAFLSELRRTASMASVATGNSTDSIAAAGNGKAARRELVIWNGFSMDHSARAAVGESLGMPVRAGSLATLGVVTTSAATDVEPVHFAPAVALALSGLAEGEKDSVDFLHSRLAAPPKPLVDKRIVWSGAAALLLILLIVIAVIERNAQQAGLDTANKNWTAIQDPLKIATAEVQKIEYAGQFRGGTPRVVACLRDLTNAMPDDGISYLTRFELREDEKTHQIRGKLTCKTRTNDAAISVQNRIMASKGFAEVKKESMTAVPTRDGQEVTFTLSFRYIGHESGADQ